MISISGIDGSGKSTQIELLKEYFNKRKIKYKMIWGRGGWTPGLEFIKNIVRTDKKLDAMGREEYRKNVHANLKKKKILLIGAILDLYLYFGIYYRLAGILDCEVICDRYVWDTYVDFKVNYSMFEFDNWFIWKMLLWFIPYPENSFMIIIPAEESTNRCKSKIDDYTETEGIREKKISLYNELINAGKWTKVIDGNRKVEDVFAEIVEVLKNWK